jgi:hypothetical protein
LIDAVSKQLGDSTPGWEHLNFLQIDRDVVLPEAGEFMGFAHVGFNSARFAKSQADHVG